MMYDFKPRGVCSRTMQVELDENRNVVSLEVEGGCSGNNNTAYNAILSNWFDFDYYNFGFSGRAKGELAMADYINTIDMGAFIYDYDHNAPTVEHLQNTHERMFRTIRKAQPNLPILILPRPRYTLQEEEKQRFAVIEQTYRNALAAGDKNVYLIDGPTLMALCGDEGTIEGCHPNDFGFASMAKAIGDKLEEIFRK